LIVKVCAPLVPPAVVTVTSRAPSAVVPPMTKLAVIDVLLTTVTLSTVTPPPLTAMVAPETKFVPVSVTATVAARSPLVGLMLVSVGGGGFTVKVSAPVVPPAVVTVTSRAPVAAPPSIVKVAVIDVSLTTVTSLTVMPVPLTVTVAPETKLVPVSVTATALPCTPPAGLEDDGAGVPPDLAMPDGRGLANTRDRLAGLHGGAASLTVAPGPAGGTMATMRMPYREIRREPMARDDGRTPAARPEWGVLIADDEPAARRGVRQLLAAHPEFAVVGECRDGAEVLRMLDAARPHVVFLDVQMPGIDGFEVIRTGGEGFVRAHRRTLVRLGAVRELRAAADGELAARLASGAPVPISRRRRAAFTAAVRAQGQS
jgi:hypothetical protein